MQLDKYILTLNNHKNIKLYNKYTQYKLFHIYKLKWYILYDISRTLQFFWFRKKIVYCNKTYS